MIRPLNTLSFLLIFLCAVSAKGESPESVLDEIRGAELSTQARSVEELQLDLGFARLHLHSGLLYPARIAGDRTAGDRIDGDRIDGDRIDGDRIDGDPVAEIVFIGDGTLFVETEDDIEASQLELFSGSRSLEEKIDGAVMAVALDSTVKALLAGPPATEASPASGEEARELFATWRDGPLRELVGAEVGLALDRLGEPGYGGYFGAWFRGEASGDLLLSVQPESPEQLVLGRFVPAEIEDKEKLEKQVERWHREGRHLGLDVDKLGEWDTWMSASLGSGALGTGDRPGFAAFEPTHYVLDVELEPKDDRLRVTAKIQLTPQVAGARSVGFTLLEDLIVEAVRDGSGRELFHARHGSKLRVFLPEVATEKVSVEIDYAGTGLSSYEKSWRPVRNLGWHPRTGTVDRATYDLRLTWPKRWDMLASGDLVAEEVRGESRWQHRRLERPGLGVSFTFGKFRIKKYQAGHVTVTLAIDDNLQWGAKVVADDLGDILVSSMSYFGEVFGPYPDDQLTVVTVPSLVSQSLPGFMHLSNWGMAGGRFRGIGGMTGNALIAHEVAHQWWGNQIGWKTYRDQWISEAMANYSALLWARQNGDFELRGGPTRGWKNALTARLPDGRPVESLGPLVLGARLASSLSETAYQKIVYQKGAVVVDMLATFWGEEHFAKILGHFTRAAAGHLVSTEDFFAALEKITGAELDPFVDRFVYGTGLPEVFYDFSFEDLGNGRHKVSIEAEQEVPFRFRHSIVETPLGLDVRRERIDQNAARDGVVPLVVPFQIELEVAAERRKRKRDRKTHTLTGRISLEERVTRLEMEIEHVPQSLRLDGDGRVFGRFFNRHDDPKDVAFKKALGRADEVPVQEARRLFEEVLKLSTPIPEESKRSRRKAIEGADRRTDWRCHIQLARLAADSGELHVMANHLRRADDLRPKEWKSYERAQKIAEARLDLLTGDAAGAFRSLRKVLRRQERRALTETWLLMAIAAQRVGETEELEKALEALEDSGVDVALLKSAT